MNYFVTYDITETRLRTKLAKSLERQGLKRIQYSVFFFKSPMPRELTAIRESIHHFMQEAAETDSILLIPVQDAETDLVEVIGKNEKYSLANKIKNTQFF